MTNFKLQQQIPYGKKSAKKKSVKKKSHWSCYFNGHFLLIEIHRQSFINIFLKVLLLKRKQDARRETGTVLFYFVFCFIGKVFAV